MISIVHEAAMPVHVRGAADGVVNSVDKIAQFSLSHAVDTVDKIANIWATNYLKKRPQ